MRNETSRSRKAFAEPKEGERVEGAFGTGTVLAVEDGAEYGQPGRVARVKWDAGGSSRVLVGDLRRGVVGLSTGRGSGSPETERARWEETPAGFRGVSEDVYSAAVAALAAVLAGQDKVQTVAPGWTVRGELFGPEVRITAVPTDDAKGRAAVQSMKRFRGERPLTFPAVDAHGREVRVTVPEDEVAGDMLDGVLGRAGIRRKA